MRELKKINKLENLFDRMGLSCDFDLWPSDPKSWLFHPSTPWTTYADFQQNRRILFKKIKF